MSYIPKWIFALQTGNELQGAEAAKVCCESLETIISEAPFPVTPCTLPEGYSNSRTISQDRVTLRYFDGIVCGDKAGRLRDGVIELAAGPLNTITNARNGQEYVHKVVVSWQRTNATAFNYEGKPAVGYPHVWERQEPLTKTAKWCIRTSATILRRSMWLTTLH